MVTLHITLYTYTYAIIFADIKYSLVILFHLQCYVHDGLLPLFIPTCSLIFRNNYVISCFIHMFLKALFHNWLQLKFFQHYQVLTINTNYQYSIVVHSTTSIECIYTILLWKHSTINTPYKGNSTGFNNIRSRR